MALRKCRPNMTGRPAAGAAANEDTAAKSADEQVSSSVHTVAPPDVLPGTAPPTLFWETRQGAASEATDKTPQYRGLDPPIRGGRQVAHRLSSWRRALVGVSRHGCNAIVHPIRRCHCLPAAWARTHAGHVYSQRRRRRRGATAGGDDPLRQHQRAGSHAHVRCTPRLIASRVPGN